MYKANSTQQVTTILKNSNHHHNNNNNNNNNSQLNVSKHNQVSTITTTSSSSSAAQTQKRKKKKIAMTTPKQRQQAADMHRVKSFITIQPRTNTLATKSSSMGAVQLTANGMTTTAALPTSNHICKQQQQKPRTTTNNNSNKQRAHRRGKRSHSFVANRHNSNESTTVQIKTLISEPTQITTEKRPKSPPALQSLTTTSLVATTTGTTLAQPTASPSRWAGGAWANSPPPSCLPVPVFSSSGGPTNISTSQSLVALTTATTTTKPIISGTNGVHSSTSPPSDDDELLNDAHPIPPVRQLFVDAPQTTDHHQKQQQQQQQISIPMNVRNNTTNGLHISPQTVLTNLQQLTSANNVHQNEHLQSASAEPLLSPKKRFLSQSTGSTTTTRFMRSQSVDENLMHHQHHPRRPSPVDQLFHSTATFAPLPMHPSGPQQPFLFAPHHPGLVITYPPPSSSSSSSSSSSFHSVYQPAPSSPPPTTDLEQISCELRTILNIPNSPTKVGV